MITFFAILITVFVLLFGTMFIPLPYNFLLGASVVITLLTLILNRLSRLQIEQEELKKRVKELLGSDQKR